MPMLFPDCQNKKDKLITKIFLTFDDQLVKFHSLSIL